jgi:hypothetical protein
LISKLLESNERQVANLPHLGNLSATMGDLANALRASGRHDESLGLKEVCIDFHTLSEIAQAGGNRMPEQLVQVCHALMLACLQQLASGTLSKLPGSLPPELEQLLAPLRAVTDA